MLTYLKLQNCESMNSDQAMALVLPNLPWLKHLNIDYLHNITIKTLQTLLRYNKNLEYLSMVDNENIDKNAIEVLVSMKSLKNINVQHCKLGQVDVENLYRKSLHIDEIISNF